MKSLKILNSKTYRTKTKKSIAIFSFVVITVLLACIGILFANIVIISKANPYIKEPKNIKKESTEVAIVLGARVFDENTLSYVLADRVDTAVDLYKVGKVKKILLSGDHGRKDYDEVNAMRNYAISKGVPVSDIFMDHAGFNTYDSMYRARDVFGVKKAYVITQKFHLFRAVYIARSLGIKAIGVVADKHIYLKQANFEIREILARVKALFDTNIIKRKPKYLGPKIPITGDGRQTVG